MQIDSPELEWYYPLLKPYEHYIPMVANESWVNLEEVIGWAEAHQEEVAKIVENATAFAIRYLSAQGRSVLKACSMYCFASWSVRSGRFQQKACASNFQAIWQVWNVRQMCILCKFASMCDVWVQGLLLPAAAA